MKEYCWRIHQGDKKAAYRELQSLHPSPSPKTEAEKLQEAIYRELQSLQPSPRATSRVPTPHRSSPALTKIRR